MKKTELSKREQEVLQMVAEGLTDKEIAHSLGISIATLKSYWLRIRQKTGGYNRTEAVVLHLERVHEREARQQQGSSLISDLVNHITNQCGVDGFVTDEQGTILYAATQSLNGHSSTLVGRQITETLNVEDERDFALAVRRAACDKVEQRFAARLSFPNGRIRLYRCFLAPASLSSGRSGVLVAVRPERAS